MKDLKISGLNFDIVWKDKKENFRRIEELLGNTPTEASLVFSKVILKIFLFYQKCLRLAFI